MKVDIMYGDTPLNATWQTKSFEDEIKAVEWCRKNHKKIWSINGNGTSGQNLSHFEIIERLRDH